MLAAWQNATGGEMVDNRKEEPVWARYAEKLLIPVAVGVVLAALGVAWNWGTQGGVVRLLGGVTQADLESQLASQGPRLPPNAVVALADNTGCVSPWKDAAFLSGRFILAAGDGFKLNDKGGQTSVMLAINQLPPHQHNTALASAFEAEYVFGRGDNVPKSLYGGAGVDNQSGALTSSVPAAGTQTALSVMPPYYVLTYCVFDAA